METIRCPNLEVTVDDEGFLVNPEKWNEDVAYLLATRAGIDLNEAMLSIIAFLRNYYQEYHAFPILRQVCRNLDLPRQCVYEAFMDPMRAWKIAGLPRMVGVDFISTDPDGRIFEASVPT